VGYRWYDAKEIEPLFPFGFGLSYTTFTYSDLKVSPSSGSKNVTVEFNVTNSGKVAGAEVAQVYLGLPSQPLVPQPPRQLKGFHRVELEPGQKAHVTVLLDERSLSYWDTATHGWKVASGPYAVSVGGSSRDVRLSDSFTVE
jgi:beta-glucosidase